MDLISTGILSYGMSGRLFHAPFIESNPGFSLAAVTERTVKTAAHRYPHFKSYDTVEGLLNDPTIELVIVNTPNFTHYDFAKKAILAGKHVLVEKPFAASSAQAQELFDLGRQMNVKVMPYQNRRWDSDFLSVKRVIEGGQLGRLSEVNIRFDRYRIELSPKTFKETQVPAAGISYDLGPHILDQAISLFGKPLKTIKSTGTYRPNSQVDDYISIHLIYPEQLHVNLTATLLCADPLPSFSVHGLHGSFIKNRTDIQEAQLDKEMLPTDEAFGIEPNGSEGKLTLICDGEKYEEYIPALPANYMGLFDAAYKHIRCNEPFPIREDEIIWQMQILEEDSI